MFATGVVSADGATATVGAGVVAAGACATGATGAEAAGAVLGKEFTATGADGCATATGAVFALAMVFAIATRVLCMPLSVAATDASWLGVNVVFAASELSNWLSVAESVPKVVWNALS